MSRSLCWLVLIAAVSAVFRFFPMPAHYLELDSAIYLRAAAEYQRALWDGTLWTRSLTPENYTAIGYWPPLFPMLAGLLGNAWTLAAGAGWLLFLPVFVLARNLWQDEDTALLASGLVALHPLLAWYARVPRTESLFLLLYALGLALALSPAPGGDRGARPGPGRFLLGGAFLGLAYATRFDMLLILPAVLLWQILLRTRREAGLTLLGFFLAALPYLVYLAWLNEGIPTLISAEKSLYDTLEGAWTTATGQTMFQFTAHFGPPGRIRVDPADPLVRELLSTRVPGMLLRGVFQLPATLASASWNWTLLLFPAALSLIELRDRRSLALLVLLVPVPLLAVLTSWDPNPRYQAFTLLPLALLAARGLVLLCRKPAPDPLACRVIFGVVAPMQLAAAWIVPIGPHFDQRGPVDHCFYELIPEARGLQAAILGLGFGAFALAGWRWGPRPGGLVGSALALAVGAGPVSVALGHAEGLYRMVLPLALLGLAFLPLLAGLTLPRSLWGSGMRTWLLGAMGLLALQNGLVLAGWDLAHTRLVHCPAVADFLARQPLGTRLLAYQQVDALRSGAEWVPLPRSRGLGAVLEAEKPDFVLLSIPETGSAAGAVVAVPDLESTGRVDLVGNHPAGGGVVGCPRAWRLYRVLPPGSRGRGLQRTLPDRQAPGDFPHLKGGQG